jgi:hypothetical protein
VRQVYTHVGASEGIAPDRLGDVDLAAEARWLANNHPRRRYPAALLGSSNGALTHPAAALHAPWPPGTMLVPVARTGDPSPQATRSLRRAGRATPARRPPRRRAAPHALALDSRRFPHDVTSLGRALAALPRAARPWSPLSVNVALDGLTAAELQVHRRDPRGAR